MGAPDASPLGAHDGYALNVEHSTRGRASWGFEIGAAMRKKINAARDLSD